MAGSKRIIISLPETLLDELNGMMGLENKNRSELIREAMRFYLEEKRRCRLRDEMRRGYQEMAQINLRLAQESFQCEEEVSIVIERRLMECG